MRTHAYLFIDKHIRKERAQTNTHREKRESDTHAHTYTEVEGERI